MAIDIVDTFNGDETIITVNNVDSAEKAVISLNTKEHGLLCYTPGHEPKWFRYMYEQEKEMENV